MGTYTTNYNLFMPSIGEQGWGELVNGNFATIDTTMKGLSNSIGTLETAFENIITENGVVNANEVNANVIRVNYTASLTNSSGVGVAYCPFTLITNGSYILFDYPHLKTGTLFYVHPDEIANMYLAFGVKGGSFKGGENTISFSFTMNCTGDGANTATIYHNGTVLGTLAANNNRKYGSYTVELTAGMSHDITWSCTSTEGSISSSGGTIYLNPVSE